MRARATGARMKTPTACAMGDSSCTRCARKRDSVRRHDRFQTSARQRDFRGLRLVGHAPAAVKPLWAVALCAAVPARLFLSFPGSQPCAAHRISPLAIQLAVLLAPGSFEVLVFRNPDHALGRQVRKTPPLPTIPPP